MADIRYAPRHPHDKKTWLAPYTLAKLRDIISFTKLGWLLAVSLHTPRNTENTDLTVALRLLGFNRDEGTVLASCEGTPKCAILQKGGRTLGPTGECYETPRGAPAFVCATQDNMGAK